MSIAKIIISVRSITNAKTGMDQNPTTCKSSQAGDIEWWLAACISQENHVLLSTDHYPPTKDW